MNRESAQQQIAGFFSRIGLKETKLDTKDFIEARIGESFVGFEFDESDEVLSAQSLIYRFREQPKDEVLDALFAEESVANNGGGRLVLNSETDSFYLQKDFYETEPDEKFYFEVNELAQASLIWSYEILSSVAEKVNSAV